MTTYMIIIRIYLFIINIIFKNDNLCAYSHYACIRSCMYICTAMLNNYGANSDGLTYK